MSPVEGPLEFGVSLPMQVVFLYRFLQENLSYITTMLAMRLPPVHPQAAGQLQQQEQQQQAEEHQESEKGQQQQQQQQEQPFLLLLDVEMDAPVISLPRNTHRQAGGSQRVPAGWHLLASCPPSCAAAKLCKSVVEVQLRTFSWGRTHCCVWEELG